MASVREILHTYLGMNVSGTLRDALIDMLSYKSLPSWEDWQTWYLNTVVEHLVILLPGATGDGHEITFTHSEHGVVHLSFSFRTGTQTLCVSIRTSNHHVCLYEEDPNLLSLLVVRIHETLRELS